MLPWLLIPVKSLVHGKSRLAPMLDDAARRELNETLLVRMLEAASECPGRDRTAVISECTEALRVATVHGATALRQSMGEGLNGAVGEGVRALRRDNANALMIVAADLPLVTGEDLLVIARGGNERELVIWTDKHRTGTNALFLPADASLRFRFGPDSCAAHAREARAGGLTVSVQFNPRVAFDIDTPEDLQRWYASNTTTESRDMRARL